MVHIDREEREPVVRYITNNMPEGLLPRIYEETHKNLELLILNHFGLGIEVRSLFRSGSLHNRTLC